MGVDTAVIVLKWPVAIPRIPVDEKVINVVVRIAPNGEGRVSRAIASEAASFEVTRVAQGIIAGATNSADDRVVGIPRIQIARTIDGITRVLAFPEIAICALNVAFGKARVGSFDHVVNAPVDAIDINVKEAPVGSRLAQGKLSTSAKFIACVLRLVSGTAPLPTIV